jgi:hypothetical protein
MSGTHPRRGYIADPRVVIAAACRSDKIDLRVGDLAQGGAKPVLLSVALGL